MKNSSQGKKLASGKYVEFKGGPSPKNIKTNVQRPSVKNKFHGKTFGKAGSESLREDTGLQ